MPRWSSLCPGLDPGRPYDRLCFRADLTAGVTTAVMLVPQSMAYALMAGLPPVVGLYAAILPLVAYALVGSARQLAVGPVAVLSLMVASSVPAAGADAAEAVPHALALAFLAGAIQFIFGLLGGGRITALMSRPLVGGFTTAAALIIGQSQLRPLLGLQRALVTAGDPIVRAELSAFADFAPTTALVGLTTVILLIALRRYAPRLPRALVALTIVTGTVELLGLGRTVGRVGIVPQGLPTPDWPEVPAETWLSLLPTAAAIAFVSFAESFAIAQRFAALTGHRVEPRRELLGLGLASIVASLFGGYSVTGGFSRTAVNAQAGARTQFAALWTALFVASTLLWLTPWFAAVPRCALAAIIITALASLIDVAEVRHLARDDRGGLGVFAASFAATLLFGVVGGLITGVGAELAHRIVAKRISASSAAPPSLKIKVRGGPPDRRGDSSGPRAGRSERRAACSHGQSARR